MIEPDNEDEEEKIYIPCALWDPDDPDTHRNKFSELSKPLRVDLRPGDMLYLPSLW